MNTMIDYEIKFTRSDRSEPDICVIAAGSRDDAIKTVKNIYRRVRPEILGAHKVNKSDKVTEQVTKEPTEFDKCRAAVVANAYSGLAIAHYFTMVLGTDPDSATLRREVEWVMRQVANKKERLAEEAAGFKR
jgi:hypothetical protein